MSSKLKQQCGRHGKKVLAAIMAAVMGISFPVSGTSAAAETERQTLGEDSVYGYGTMTMSYAEFYAGDVDNANIDAVSSATTTKYLTFPNSDVTEPTDDGYQINGVKNVPVKVMESASQELKDRVTFNEDRTAELKQYKIVDGNGIGATTYNIVDTVTDADANLSTNSVWGDYEIDIIEKSTAYLRNTRSDIKDTETNEKWAIGSNIQGIILETTDGYRVAAMHMENIWVQPYEVAFSLEGNANSAEFGKLVDKTVSEVTFIVPGETYVYDLGEGVYIKPAYQSAVSGKFSEDRTKFILDEVPTGLTNATISIIWKEGRSSTTLLGVTSLSGTEYTLEEALPEGKSAIITVSSDEYADITVDYPMMAWQREQLEGMVSTAAAILTKIDDGMLKEHKEEAEELLANASATAGEAEELITELTSLIASASANPELLETVKKELSDVIDEAKKLSEADYTQSSWTEFAARLRAAEAQLAVPGTWEEVEQSSANLRAAMSALVKEERVTQNTPATLSLSNTKATLYTGNASNAITITAAVTGGTSKTVTWRTSNPKVASVKDGKITALKKGTATITATANGISKTVKVTVKNPTITIKNSGKKFTKSKLTVKKKKKATLTVAVNPKKSGISIAKLTAKQKKIATVTLKGSKITIKGKKKGSFTLKIKSGKAVRNIKITVK